MLAMLNPSPEKRKTAREMLSHPWILSADAENVKMTDDEYKAYLLNKKANEDEEPEYINKMDKVDSDNDYAGSEDNSVAEYSDNEEAFYDYKANIDTKLVDRSFTNMGYIGFGEGIDLDALDNTGNW